MNSSFTSSSSLPSPSWLSPRQVTFEPDGDEELMIMSHPYVRLFFLTAYIMVFITCVFGNMVILIVIITNKSMRTATNFFLANLAVADLLVGIFCVLQNAVHFVLFEHAWPFSELMCHTYIYMLHMIPNASAGILVRLYFRL